MRRALGSQTRTPKAGASLFSWFQARLHPQGLLRTVQAAASELLSNLYMEQSTNGIVEEVGYRSRNPEHHHVGLRTRIGAAGSRSKARTDSGCS